jgi:hypothetical protein
VTGKGCEFRRTTSQRTEADRRGPQAIGFAKPHPSEGRASERHLLGVIHGVRQLSGQRAGIRSGNEAYVPVVNHPADAYGSLREQGALLRSSWLMMTGNASFPSVWIEQFSKLAIPFSDTGTNNSHLISGDYSSSSLAKLPPEQLLD